MKFEDMKLSDVCEYSKDRIEVAQIDLNTYISTENLLPGKSGKVRAASLPDAKTTLMYKEGDTLISNIRPYFKKIWYGNCTGGASNDVLIFRPNKEKVYNKYLYYFLSQDKIFDFMVQTSKGTKMPRGDKAALMEYPIKLPPYEIQVSISEFLSKIDEKIKVNKEILNKLEKLADVLFKHWFIDFEFPDAEGRPYKSSGGKMMGSELGDIPEGWSVRSLDEIAHYQNGLAMQKYPPTGETSLPVLKIKELREGRTDSNSDRCSFDIKESVKVYDGDIIFSWSATLLVKQWTGGVAGLNQHLFKVTSEEFPKWFYYLWTQFHLERFIAIAADKATTMGHIKRSHLKEAKVLIPSETQIIEMTKTIKPLIDLCLTKGLESRILEELRDSLLPKLLSGEVELPQDGEVTMHEPV